MKKVLLLTIVIFIFSCNGSEGVKEKRKETIAAIEEFDWLVGTWERTNEKPDKQTYESWQKINELEYRGVGFTLQKNDTIWKEDIRLISLKNNWNFEVIGKGDSTPTIFKLINIKKGKFICENQENEFPKKIEYTKEGDKIRAIISGGEMEIPFEFERIKKISTNK